MQMVKMSINTSFFLPWEFDGTQIRIDTASSDIADEVLFEAKELKRTQAPVFCGCTLYTIGLKVQNFLRTVCEQQFGRR